VRRAFMAGGHDGALAEVRRRYLSLTDRTAPQVLDLACRVPFGA